VAEGGIVFVGDSYELRDLLFLQIPRIMEQSLCKLTLKATGVDEMSIEPLEPCGPLIRRQSEIIIFCINLVEGLVEEVKEGHFLLIPHLELNNVQKLSNFDIPKIFLRSVPIFLLLSSFKLTQFVLKPNFIKAMLLHLSNRASESYLLTQVNFILLFENGVAQQIKGFHSISRVEYKALF
jgi:hypothetical protein